MAGKKKAFDYEESLAELNDIIGQLENDEIKLDDAIKLYKDGIDHIVKCSNALKKFEQQVTEITKKADDTLKDALNGE